MSISLSSNVGVDALIGGFYTISHERRHYHIGGAARRRE
jgi:hypothetical protein